MILFHFIPSFYRSNQNPEMEADNEDDLDIADGIERERASSEESCHGLETAIECETKVYFAISCQLPLDFFFNKSCFLSISFHLLLLTYAIFLRYHLHETNNYSIRGLLEP